MDEDEIRKLFKGVSVEPDTRLMMANYVMFGGKPARMELWTWEGITGHSVVFRTRDTVRMTDEELIEMVRGELGVEDPVTIKRKEDFVYVNHSFSP